MFTVNVKVMFASSVNLKTGIIMNSYLFNKYIYFFKFCHNNVTAGKELILNSRHDMKRVWAFIVDSGECDTKWKVIAFLYRFRNPSGAGLSDSARNAERWTSRRRLVSFFAVQCVCWASKCPSSLLCGEWPLWGLDSTETRPPSVLSGWLWDRDTSYPNRNPRSPR